MWPACVLCWCVVTTYRCRCIAAFGSAAISTTGTFEFKFKDTPELGRLDYGGDSADDLNVAIPDLSSFATPSCECVVNGYIDAEVYLTSADLGIGFIGLVDEDDVEVTANITEGQVIGAETWSRVSFVLPGVQGKLQWGSIKSWCVAARRSHVRGLAANLTRAALCHTGSSSMTTMVSASRVTAIRRCS